VLQNIFSKAHYQPTLNKNKQINQASNNLMIELQNKTLKTKLQTLDSLTVMGRFRRYCPESATLISSSVAILKLLFFITWVKNQIIWTFQIYMQWSNLLYGPLKTTYSRQPEFNFWVEQFLVRLCLPLGQTPDYQDPFSLRIGGSTHKKIAHDIICDFLHDISCDVNNF